MELNEGGATYAECSTENETPRRALISYRFVDGSFVVSKDFVNSCCNLQFSLFSQHIPNTAGDHDHQLVLKD